jgi:hypothetical protein
VVTCWWYLAFSVKPRNKASIQEMESPSISETKASLSV